MLNKLTMPPTAKPAVMGAIAGAVACALVGFIWGGWVTGATARGDAEEAAREARVSALADICVYRFRNQEDAGAKLARLADASFWERTDLVVKSGSANLPANAEADREVARVCGNTLANSANGKT
jgi:hypothetical protein